MNSPVKSTVTYRFKKNSETVEKSFRRNQVTLEQLAMAFKVRNSLLIILLMLL